MKAILMTSVIVLFSNFVIQNEAGLNLMKLSIKINLR